MTNHSQQNFNGKYFTFLVFFPCKIQYFGPKIVKNYQFTWFCSQRSIFKSKLSPKKERSIRKYGKSPNEVSFFERSITGHPGLVSYLEPVGLWHSMLASVFNGMHVIFIPYALMKVNPAHVSPMLFAFLLRQKWKHLKVRKIMIVTINVAENVGI